MKIVDYRDWPKPRLWRDYALVAQIDDDFDALAARIAAQPKTFTQRATRESPRIQYRAFFFRLSNKASGSINQNVEGKSHIELLLPVVRDEFAFLDDYEEVVATLKPRQIHRFDGNFTWLPNRKAKRVSPKEEPLPEDWWNHVRVLSAEENAKRKGFK
ncbi:hypothetical protein [Ramlibacter sp. WS9]|uniref:hypothetical protein n=1 Tax=Ramlibacter sp. WS9 TaxID=1882741 RepID=UPI001143CF99|nr:hypothetical protein [Ramlibacter sp. WS9]ROZ61460.1 hypothetical protein EEB15_32660 [Ramlibacter sp. WS9]